MEGHHLHIICIIYNENPVDCLRNYLGSKAWHDHNRFYKTISSYA